MKTKEEILEDKKKKFPYKWGRGYIASIDKYESDLCVPNKVALQAMQEYADQETAELRRQLQSKPDLIVPGEEEIEEWIDSGFYAHDPIVNRAIRHYIRKAATWAINRIKELNK